MASKDDSIRNTMPFQSDNGDLLTNSTKKMEQDSVRPKTLIHSIPHLTREAELKRLLSDERTRCEQHKTNYQALKNEHLRLQNEFLALQMELKAHLEELKYVKESCQEAINTSEHIIGEKDKEIQELKFQLSLGNPEVVKQKIKEDIEKPLKEKCLKLRDEIDHCQDEFNVLRYENAMLKTKWEYAEREYQNNLEQLKLSSAKEISSLKQLIDDIQVKQTTDKSQEAKRLGILEEENAKLVHKIKLLQAEIEELEAEKKKVKADGRIQAMHQNELTAKLWNLETDLASTKAQRDSLESELTNNRQSLNSLRSEVKELKDKEVRLRSIIEDKEQMFKKELADLKMAALADKSGVEREREEIAVELKSVKLDLESEKSAVMKLEQTLEAREKESQAKFQSFRQQEWEKQKRLETEIHHLEMQLRDAEKMSKELDTKYKYKLDEMKEELNKANSSKLSLERELVLIRAQLEGLQSSKVEIIGVQKQNSMLQEELQRIKNNATEMSVAQKELLRERDQLQDSMAKIRKMLEEVNLELAKEREGKEHTLLQQQLNHSQEKHQYQSRIEELENRIRNANLQFSKETDELKNKQRQYARLITKLRNKLELASARQQELEIENEALQKRVPQEVFADLKKQLRDLQRRHMEFNQLVGSTPFSNIPPIEGSYFAVPSYIASQGTIAHQFDSKSKDPLLVNVQELQYLKERLEELDKQQKQQVEKIASFVDRPLRNETKPKKVNGGDDTDEDVSISGSDKS